MKLENLKGTHIWKSLANEISKYSYYKDPDLYRANAVELDAWANKNLTETDLKKMYEAERLLFALRHKVKVFYKQEV